MSLQDLGRSELNPFAAIARAAKVAMRNLDCMGQTWFDLCTSPCQERWKRSTDQT